MNESDGGLLGIGEVARLVGLDADTLRFYERRGVLPKPARDAGGRRRYTATQVEAIRRLVVLKSTGMSLADIAHFANLAGTKLDPDQLEVLHQHEAELRATRRRLDASLEFLEHKLHAAKNSEVGQMRYLTRSDADIAYSVTGSGPRLFLVGAPAGRSGFASLADALSGSFTVVTHDPRGIGDSSTPTDTAPTPQILADDLIALIGAVSDGPVSLFGTSGGAVTVLETIAQASHLVGGAIVHEPPLITLLDDPSLERQAASIFGLATQDPQTAFHRWLDLSGAGQSTGPGQSPVPLVNSPALTHDELDRNRYFLGSMAGPTVFYRPDLDALVEHLPVVCAGSQSHGQLARRISEALAHALGLPLVEMPGNHLAASTHASEVAGHITEMLQR